MNQPVVVTAPQAQATFCRVHGVRPLSARTYLVELDICAPTVPAYLAGQYLKMDLDIHSDGQTQPLFYSIANSANPHQPRRLQLFIQQNSTLSEAIIQRLADIRTPLKITLPLGKAFLQSDVRLPHLLIASGSGISKIKCLADEIIKQNPDAKVQVYWSNRNADDFYLLDEFREWEKQGENLSFTPILESAADQWTGRTGYIFQVIQEDFGDLSGSYAYLCGSPQMVYGTIDQLAEQGLKEEQCYSDVFEYAPRERVVLAGVECCGLRT